MDKSVILDDREALIYRMVPTKDKKVFKLIPCKLSKRSKKLNKNDLKLYD